MVFLATIGALAFVLLVYAITNSVGPEFSTASPKTQETNAGPSVKTVTPTPSPSTSAAPTPNPTTEQPHTTPAQ
jgi:hypothetical protein